MTNKDFNEKFRLRTRAFAVQIFKFLEKLPPGIASRNIGYQLSRSASSVGANFRAFCRGRSGKERFSKMCIVMEEADESEYWLQIIQDLNLGNPTEVKALLREIDEIVRIVSTIKEKFKP